MAAGEGRIEKVLRSLQDPGVGRIVLFSMNGGVGKTWTARHAMRRAMDTDLFDIFVWVTLSVDLNWRHAQRRIAENLSIPIPTDRADGEGGEIVSMIRHEIWRILSEKRFLLVLDDAWLVEGEVLDLMGVPCPGPKNLSKVIVTTRSTRTFVVMEPAVVFEPEALPAKESWSLFCDVAGESFTSPAVHSVAQTCLGSLTNLRHLSLRRCRCTKSELHLEVLTMLKELDLSGTTLVEFPYEISKLTQLKRVDLSGTRYTRRLNWEALQWLPENLNWENCDVSDTPMELVRNDGGVRVAVGDSDFLISLDKNSQLWENCFKKFHFYVSPSERGSLENDIRFQRKQFIFRDIYFESRHFAHSVDHTRYLEICGVSSYPEGIEGVLNNAELLFLNNNAFMKRLSDLGFENMKVMKECWIERCDEAEVVFTGDDVQVIAAIGRLENLWISNLANLRHLCEGMERPMSFSSLQHLHVDCCPNLVSMFSSALRLENLVSLQIKFCDKLECVFGESVVGQETLPQLRTLRLWELPEFKSICEGHLPLLNMMKVKECPKLKKLPLDANDIRPLVEIRGERGPHRERVSVNLESWVPYFEQVDQSMPDYGDGGPPPNSGFIFRCKGKLKEIKEDLERKTRFSMSLGTTDLLQEPLNNLNDMERPMSFSSLQHLHVDCCPNLVSMFSSALRLENLVSLQIKFCDKLECVFGESVVGQETLPQLRTLRLWELPEFKSICEGHLPLLNMMKVKECPKLKKLPLDANDIRPLVEIRGERCWWNNLMWEDERVHTSLHFRNWGRF
ncbi:hypothetical protein COCNU_06G010270 [Cocos nucifera]|uniref:NB-ARC domain-containing protein n=1 Tax=Cocos nucifera TaxID=13894 RepID=A0A8K0N2R7_COCNU|nr:hypothetical protein COCNU_06G010270 [Cocos nucifera]